MRSSMKSPISCAKDAERIKRTISFNLQTEKAHVEIQPSKDEILRQLFTSSRVPASVNQETPRERAPTVTSQGPDCVADDPDSVPDRVRWKSKSLGRNDAKKVAPDLMTKRRHSDIATNRPILRDSAIDLISDDDHSEAYTAVSLAGTLKRGAPALHTDINRRKYVIIAAVCVAVIVIIVLSVLLANK